MGGRGASSTSVSKNNTSKKIFGIIGKVSDFIRERKHGTSVDWEKELKKITLPQLEGSEKQIKWANDIKSNQIKKAILNSLIDYNEMREATPGKRRYNDLKERVNKHAESIKNYANITSAKTIIEGRYENILEKF